MAWTREEMAARAAKELKDGYYVNLGIGIPTLVANYIPKGMTVTLQSENGMLGMGPFPLDAEVDAGTVLKGVSARDTGQVVVAMNGPWVGATFGVSLRAW